MPALGDNLQFSLYVNGNALYSGKMGAKYLAGNFPASMLPVSAGETVSFNNIYTSTFYSDTGFVTTTCIKY